MVENNESFNLETNVVLRCFENFAEVFFFCFVLRFAEVMAFSQSYTGVKF